MGKIENLLDLTSHPENYSEEEIREMLADPECAELYRLMCGVSDALHSDDSLSEACVEQRWRRFRRSRLPRARKWDGRKWAASAAVSISLLAIAGGIGYSLRVQEQAESGPGQQDVRTSRVPADRKDPSFQIPLSESASQAPDAQRVVFENQPLDEILKSIGDFYGRGVFFASADKARLRLYFTWDKTRSLEEAVEALNNFEQIDITVSDKTLTVN